MVGHYGMLLISVNKRLYLHCDAEEVAFVGHEGVEGRQGSRRKRTLSPCHTLIH